MERIKTNYALSLNAKIAIFGRPYYVGETPTYFLGWRADYVGPRDPRYKTKGAHYDGAIIAEIPPRVADCLAGIRDNKNNPDWLKFFTPADLLTAAEVLGICDALAYPGDEFANITATNFYNSENEN